MVLFLYVNGQGCGEEKKMAGCKRNFFKTLECIEKFFGREGDIY
jgi:hypothetical protein